MFNLAVKNFFEKNLPLKVYGNLNDYSHDCLLNSRFRQMFLILH